MADRETQRLDDRLGLGERIGAGHHHEIGERRHHDGVEAQQRRGLGIEHVQHREQPIPGGDQRSVLRRAVDRLQAGQHDRLLAGAHPRSALMLAAYLADPPENTAVPATSASAPDWMQRRAVSGLTPPSTSRSIDRPVASIALRSAAILASWLSMNACPPKPGLTLITSTRSRSPS